MQGPLTILAVITLIVSVVVLASVRPAAKGPVHVDKPTEPIAVDTHDAPPPLAIQRSTVTDATCLLQPTAGHTASGRVTFHEQDGVVTITATIHGLEPDSTHALHIHQFGDISSADGSSTGPHYNPQGHPHGLPQQTIKRHAGDLGNVTADENGTAYLNGSFDNLSINGSFNPVLGRAMILHAKPDSGGQPSGQAGARIAMGLIGVARPPPPVEEAGEVLDDEPTTSPSTEMIEETPSAEDDATAAPPAPRN